MGWSIGGTVAAPGPPVMGKEDGMTQTEFTWNLESIYPSIDSQEYRKDKEELVSTLSKPP